MKRGVFYVACGEPAIKQCLSSIASLQRSNPHLPFCVYTDNPRPFRKIGASCVLKAPESDRYGRIGKLNAYSISPYDFTLYLDADTRVFGELSLPFCALEDGWDFVATFSVNQGREKWLWHIPERERERTWQGIGFYSAQVQGGVWAFRKTQNVRSFFGVWQRVYEGAESEREQGAMQTAFNSVQMKTYFLGQDFNGGNVIRHNYGTARRQDV